MRRSAIFDVDVADTADTLFTDTVDWELIEADWQDLLQVVLSVKAGVVSSARLLRKLGTYSRRNRLYQAFAELGRVIRTGFLLDYLSSAQLREQITATTNKVEATASPNGCSLVAKACCLRSTLTSKRSVSSTTTC